MSGSELSTAQALTAAIAAAIRDRDFRAVEALIGLLALTDPHAAQRVLDTIQAAAQLGGRQVAS